MRQPTIPHDVPQRSDSAGLRFPRSEHHSADAGQYQRSSAHRAGFQRDGQGAALESPTVTVDGSRSTQRQNFRMPGGVARRLPRIAGPGDLTSGGVEHDGSDGYIGIRCLGGGREGCADHVRVGYHHRSAPQLAHCGGEFVLEAKSFGDGLQLLVGVVVGFGDDDAQHGLGQSEVGQ